MKRQMGQLLKVKLVVSTVFIFLGSILLFLGIGLFSWHKLPPQLPMFYSLPRGTEQLGTPFTLFLLPALSIIIFITNLIFSSLIVEKEKLAAKFLMIAAATSSVLLLITFAKIVFLVG